MLNVGKKCCACEACKNTCPKHCILMMEDKEGFLYPKVNTVDCINCGLCEKVCPVLHQTEKRTPVAVYAAKHDDDDVRLSSSSGGAFTFFAEKVIDDGGVVFGARFNEKWEVIHDYTETKEGLRYFKGSKYVQSQIGDTYQQALLFLQKGRKVLFTGTSCQIAGLKYFLHKDYDNLLTIDVICHGVPSPKVWKKYLNEVLPDADSRITGISFRDKKYGWKNFSLRIELNNKSYIKKYSSDLYFSLFLSNITLRPSCYFCPAKSGKSCSDITLGDFWGIENISHEFDDDKGCSAILVYNPQKYSFADGINMISTTYNQVKLENSILEESVRCPVNRSYFFKLLEKNNSIKDIYGLCFNRTLIQRIRRLIFRKLGI